MQRKFNDDIFALCFVIMKNVVISYIKEYRPCLIRPKPDLDFQIRILKPWGCKQTECWIRIRFLEIKCKIWI